MGDSLPDIHGNLWIGIGKCLERVPQVLVCVEPTDNFVKPHVEIYDPPSSFVQMCCVLKEKIA